MFQTNKQIIKLLQFSVQKGYTLLYDSKKDIFFIHGMNYENVSFLSTYAPLEKENLFFFNGYQNKKEISAICRSLLLNKEVVMSKEKVQTLEDTEQEVKIFFSGLIEPIIFEKVVNLYDISNKINLEYTGFQLEDVKQFNQNELCFSFQNTEFNIQSGMIKKVCTHEKEIYIDFQNCYKRKYFQEFIKILSIENKKSEIFFDIARDAPIKLYALDVFMYIAPIYKGEK